MSSKIDGLGSRPASMTNGHRSSAAEHSGDAGLPSGGTTGGEVVTLTEGAVRLQRLAHAVADAPATDANRAANLRESVARGEYRVNAERVADKIPQAERELVGRGGRWVMNHPGHMQELAAIIAKKAAIANELRDTLFAERRALAAGDDGALAEATARKTTALATLESAKVATRKKCRDIAPTVASGDIQALLAQFIGDTTASSATTTIMRSWQQLRAMLLQCRDVNEANGQVVAARQRPVQQALNLLRGGRGVVATYGLTGSTQLAGASARELARA